jgi:hypothetical protein
MVPRIVKVVVASGVNLPWKRMNQVLYRSYVGHTDWHLVISTASSLLWTRQF